jgi:Uma2 family endonuclease
MTLPTPPLTLDQVRHLRAPERLVFPEEALVPETQLHRELCMLLYQLLRDYLEGSATVGSDQFVYWVADDPTQCLAPDACVRREPSRGLLRSWKTWERGAPEVAVEIVSDSDSPESAWSQKLARYKALGVVELVRFDPEAPGGRLRIWDRAEGDLVEREIDGEIAPSTVLPLTWIVAPADEVPTALRFTAGDAAAPLVPTRAEALRAEAEAHRAEAEALRAEAEAETKARRAAEARVRELEAELKRRG